MVEGTVGSDYSHCILLTVSINLKLARQKGLEDFIGIYRTKNYSGAIVLRTLPTFHFHGFAGVHCSP